MRLPHRELLHRTTSSTRTIWYSADCLPDGQFSLYGCVSFFSVKKSLSSNLFSLSRNSRHRHAHGIEYFIQTLHRENFLLASDLANGSSCPVGFLRNRSRRIVTNFWSKGGAHRQTFLNRVIRTIAV